MIKVVSWCFKCIWCECGIILDWPCIIPLCSLFWDASPMFQQYCCVEKTLALQSSKSRSKKNQRIKTFVGYKVTGFHQKVVELFAVCERSSVSSQKTFAGAVGIDSGVAYNCPCVVRSTNYHGCTVRWTSGKALLVAEHLFCRDCHSAAEHICFIQ